MAQFDAKPNDTLNPTINEAATPDYGKYSHGFQVNSSGPLLDGLGDIIKMVSSAKDEFNKNRIREEATDQVDQTRERWLGNPNMLAPPGVAPGTQPKELDARLERLRNMDQARQAGVLKDSHYYGLLDQQARELRRKYPGYREHIDNVMKDLTGVDPANARIRALASEAMRSSSEENKDAAYNITLEKETGLKAGWILGPGGHHILDARTKQPIPMEEVRVWGAATRANKYARDQEKAELELAESLGQRTEKERVRFLRKQAEDFKANITQNIQGGAGLSNKNLQETIDSITKSGLANKPLSEEEANLVRAQMVDAETKGLLAFEKEIAGPARAAGVAAKDIEDARSGIKEHYRILKDALVDRDVGRLQDLATRKENMINNRTLQMLSSNQAMTDLAAYRAIGGENLVSQYFLANPGAMGSIQKQLANDGLKGLASGSYTMDQVVNNFAANGQNKAEDWKKFILNAQKMAMDKNIGVEARKNIMNAMFGPRNQHFIEKMPVELQPDFYRTTTNPVWTQHVGKFAEETGDQSIKFNYQQFVSRNFSNVTGRPITDIKQQIIDDPRSFVGINWNPVNHQFELYRRNPSERDRTGSMTMGIPGAVAAAQNLVDTINSEVKRILPVYALSNAKPDQINVSLQRIWAIHGIDLWNLTPRQYRNTAKEKPSGE